MERDYEYDEDQRIATSAMPSLPPQPKVYRRLRCKRCGGECGGFVAENHFETPRCAAIPKDNRVPGLHCGGELVEILREKEVLCVPKKPAPKPEA